MYKKIDRCRVCGNQKLEKFLDLGSQALTGVFPKPGEIVNYMPVEAVVCTGNYPEVCNLIQLNHTYNLHQMYGDNYGYRSGLNASMVSHLRGIVDDLIKRQLPILKAGDLVLDIGSNDCTLLKFYIDLKLDLNLIGIDPTGNKFKEYYPKEVSLIPDFFGSTTVTKKLNGKKAKIITSIAMFYDLEDPISFCRQIAECLDPVHGVWVFEQAYGPTTLEKNGIDCFCQEHLEYYGLRQIKWILEKAGLVVHDVSMNESNGGSFRVTAVNSISSRFGSPNQDKINKILDQEGEFFKTPTVFEDFKKRLDIEREALLDFLAQCKKGGKVVLGLGASTKFNVLLQYYKIDANLISHIAEVNPFKFGRVTPGTNIPIISEAQAEKLAPDYYIVGPYHFKENFVRRMQPFLKNGGKLIFPLPSLEIVS